MNMEKAVKYLKNKILHVMEIVMNSDTYNRLFQVYGARNSLIEM